MREYVNIRNEHGEANFIEYPLDFLLKRIADEKQKNIWSDILKGVRHNDKKEYQSAFNVFNGIKDKIKEDKLLYFFVQKEQLFAYVFAKQVNVENTIKLYDKLIKVYTGSGDYDIKLQLAQTMIDKDFVVFKQQGGDEECLRIENSIIGKYQNVDDENFQVIVAKTMWNKACGLERLKRHDEANAVLEDIKLKYSGAASVSLQIQAAKAVISRSLNFALINSKEELSREEKKEIDKNIHILSVLIENYRGAKSVMLSIEVICAMIYKGLYLYKIDKITEAANTYCEAIRENAYVFSINKRVKDTRVNELYRMLKDETLKAINAFANDNEDILDELRRQIENNRVVPFVGAGLSAFLDYPTWEKFLADIYDAKLTHFGSNDFQNFKCEDKAEYLNNHRGYAGFIRDIEHTFSDARLKYYISKYKYIFDYAAVSPLPYLFKDMVITTNFDNVLETIYAENGVNLQTYTPVEKDGLTRAIQSGSEEGCTVYKMHGTINTPESIILTKSDYDEFYSKDSRLTKTLEVFIKGKNLLFLGCSLKEDRIMNLLESFFEKGIYHYAIFPANADKTAETFRDLGNRGILAILFPDGCFECIFFILEKILEDVEFRRTRASLEWVSKYYGVDTSELLEMIEKKREPIDPRTVSENRLDALVEQAKDMQEKVKIAQEELERILVKGSDKRRLVEVTMSCTKSVRKVSINDKILSPEYKTPLEKSIVDAFLAAKDKADNIAVEKMENATNGLELPDGAL
ncbi:MAG: SIR2 family protein [Treponema sp.]|nr:SIR2 family protein [Treponema sp.]